MNEIKISLFYLSDWLESHNITGSGHTTEQTILYGLKLQMAVMQEPAGPSVRGCTVSQQHRRKATEKESKQQHNRVGETHLNPEQ